MNLNLSLSLGAKPSLAYDLSAAELIARFTTPPTASRAALINSTILALKTAGIWDKLEVLYFLAAADSQAAQLNWKSTSFTASEVNAPTFTTDRGYAGNATTSYLNTGYIESNSVVAVQNSASIGAWINNVGTAGASDSAVIIGANAGSGGFTLVPRGVANAIRGNINGGAAANYGAGSITTNLGFSAISRTASNLLTAYRGGAAIGTATTAATGRPNIATYICGVNQLGSLAAAMNSRVAFAFMGAGLSDAEILALYNAANTYLTAVGGQ